MDPLYCSTVRANLSCSNTGTEHHMDTTITNADWVLIPSGTSADCILGNGKPNKTMIDESIIYDRLMAGELDVKETWET
jgi:hypothetical protein